MAHAPDKIARHSPERRRIYGRCVVLAGDRGGNIAEADFAPWPWSIRRLMPIPVGVVVAHGARLESDLLQDTLDVLAERRTIAQPSSR